MKTHLSHLSAALHWEVPHLPVVLGYSSAEQMLKKITAKTHISYPDPSLRKQAGTIEGHSRTLSFPGGAVVDHKGQAVSSPELVFLDLAHQLGFHRTVLLGMQLCSSNPSNHTPLVTAPSLRTFVNACQGHRGQRAASKAAQYVADNSWSIMESLLFMYLTLPNKYGGYGLKGAALNQEIALRKNGADNKNGTKRFYADLYWRQAKLVVEYDSFTHHNNSSSWMKDAKRLTSLENNGYRVVSVTTEQLYNEKAFAEVAHVIANCLGKRIQIRTSHYHEQRGLLRGMLPTWDR